MLMINNDLTKRISLCETEFANSRTCGNDEQGMTALHSYKYARKKALLRHIDDKKRNVCHQGRCNNQHRKKSG